jgi:hypothetical protein
LRRRQYVGTGREDLKGRDIRGRFAGIEEGDLRGNELKLNWE